MTLSQTGRAATATAILFLLAAFAIAKAHADVFWTQDVSISNIYTAPTPKSADIAHVSLVISNVGGEGDTLLAADVSPEIAAFAGLDALPTTVYRGASLRRSRPVFLAAGQTRTLGLDSIHLVLYGIRGPLTSGMGIPVRLVFEKAGAVDVLIEVGRTFDNVASNDLWQTVSFQPDDDEKAPVPGEPPGSLFACQDGGKLVLDLSDTTGAFSAAVSVRGQSYLLPALPPEPGPVQIVWSDGAHTLTWSPGVKLMWMSGSTHLMCGRSHQH